jgi:hypothetical protein
MAIRLAPFLPFDDQQKPLPYGVQSLNTMTVYANAFARCVTTCQG